MPREYRHIQEFETEIMSLLRNSMVLNVYRHSLDSMSQAAADTMDRIMNIS